MGIVYVFLAGLLAASSNFLLRKSSDVGGTAKAYIALQFFFSGVIALWLGPLRTGRWEFSLEMSLAGAAGGVMLVLMLLFLEKALQQGPIGLTFAMMNAAAVMPGFLMAVLFGQTFGHEYHLWHLLGSLLLLAGLFWAGSKAGIAHRAKTWVFFSCGVFAMHALFLTFMQWRALHLLISYNDHPLLMPITAQEAACEWFMPMIFITAAILQGGHFLKHERRVPLKKEWFFGVLGGLTNSLCTLSLIKATETATSFENAVIFPIYSVSAIVLSNLWGQWLYKEKVHWAANGVCLGGLALANIRWDAIVS